jgi:2-oxoglutarate dehydrogenase E2 component (dihydrolipoamide succinyltransferase)
MPQLGESVTEGTVGRWLKQVGDTVEKYEPLLEVISDKVDTEITATDAGTLVSIEVREGETVPVGTILAYIGEAGEAAGGNGAGAVAAAAPAEAQAPQAEPEPEPEPASAPEPAPSPAAQEGETALEGAAEDEAEADTTGTGTAGAPMITPVVARMIGEHNIDVSQVQGTGRDGRVTKRDIESYLEQREVAPVSAPAPVSVPEPVSAPVPTVAPTPTPAPTPQAAPRPAAPQPSAARAVQPGELVPLSNMRRRIAEHMVESKRTAPHVTTVFEADLSAVAAHRDANRAALEGRGVRLTYMPYFVEAVAQALRKHPMVNSTFTEDGIQLLQDVNVGMAVATQGGAGLLVPVVRRADEKNLGGLARDVDDLTQRTRGSQLTPDDVSGGTFTITNHGASGSLWGTPIINQPQTAIMGIGKIQKRVVVTKDDAIAIRPMVYLSLTFDHRVLDGAAADAFMSDVVNFLQSYQ